jgi:dTMP kinase
VFSEAVMRKYWITLEGIEGVGKTHLARLLGSRLGSRAMVLSEVTDQRDSLIGQVITALSRAGDLWLRTGYPATETLALLALKVSEYETLQHGHDTGAEVVVEDRGVDSVAVYQAAILADPDASVEQVHVSAQRIYAAVARWRPLPDRTLLLVDDFDVCVARFEQRTGCAVSSADRALMRRAAELYAVQAALEPGRFCIVNRIDRSEQQTLEELCRACVGPMAGEQLCGT